MGVVRDRFDHEPTKDYYNQAWDILTMRIIQRRLKDEMIFKCQQTAIKLWMLHDA